MTMRGLRPLTIATLAGVVSCLMFTAVGQARTTPMSPQRPAATSAAPTDATPLMFTVSADGRLQAHNANPDWACQSTFGSNAGPQGEEGCVSPISAANNDYCMSTYGQTSGDVTEARCNKASPNQIWWTTASGWDGTTYEIWNAGSSCPSSLAWYSCGEPYGKGHGAAYANYGYCLGLSNDNGSAGEPIVIDGCKTGNVQSMSWEGLLVHGSALIKFVGPPYGGPGYCISTRNQARSHADYVLESCSLQTSERFLAGTFGIRTFTGTPSPGGGPPKNGDLLTSAGL